MLIRYNIFIFAAQIHAKNDMISINNT